MVALLALLPPATAAAHPQPDSDLNNRYLKLTPMSDRVRLAYTVFMGHVPGAMARQRLDKDRDGYITDSESRTYGVQIGAAVADKLSVTIDGTTTPVAWSQVHVGLGTPTTDGGAFSIDLVAWLCGPELTAAHDHSLVLFDRFVIQKPGETELRVEESPGVTVGRSTLGDTGAPSQREFSWRGGAGPASSLGYYLDYHVSAETMLARSDSRCPAPLSVANKDRHPIIIGVAVLALALALLAGFVLLRRRTDR